ncbi:hypothetical protein [Rubellimicrobium roseum]|uniref:Uncharacterized protein n=1 Tax=Rubellimicrobium roseum TaxID=687525 RepID=A0A5C4NF46_9RHOB|nr:hypothetical protein [Rubellimicrobium roseum]TNC71988.1 hypothetical protein FHG71_09640 [Rubellimicrobium roseum]
MKLAYVTASTAALLLSSTAVFAQQDPAQELSNVYIDVGGTAVQVPVAQAAEACAMDEATIQQIAQTRLSESGLDPAVVYGLGNETGAVPTDTADTGAPPLDEVGTTGDTADAGGTMGAAPDAATGSDMASVDAAGTDGAETTGTGTDMATADATGTIDSTTGAAGTTGSTDITADASGTTDAADDDLASGVENIESTAAETATAGAMDDAMLQLSVCQLDQARATELGIDMSGAGTMGTTEPTDATATP